jgi:uncharacterized membrane protein (UPF0127 family)
MAIPVRLAALVATLTVAALTALPAASQSSAQPTLPTVKLTVGIHVITAETAATNQARTIGLMHRDRLAPNHGMLFVFDTKSPQCFWMRNTKIPLTVAFIEDDGTIVQLENMAPQSDDSHCSQKPVRYVLEMEQGWFAKRGIAAGSKLAGLPTSSR